jgi:type I restriction enzyme S subunit
MTPNGWGRVPLAALLSHDTPGFWGEPPNRGDGIRVLRSTNLRKDGGLDFTDIAVRCFPASKLEQKCLKSGDILLERSGGGPKQPVGRVALFTR